MEPESILLILSCKKYTHKVVKQQETWLKDIPLQYFHVIGDPGLSKDFTFEKRTLWVKTPDDYVSLPQKVIAAFEAIHQTFDYSYIFKTDDDQNLIDPGFFNWLFETLSKRRVDYGGKVIKIHTHYSNYHLIHPELPRKILLQKGSYCNGRFYLLSKQAVSALLEQKAAISKEYFEDYSIGTYLPGHLKKNTFSFNNDVYFKDFKWLKK